MCATVSTVESEILTAVSQTLYRYFISSLIDKAEIEACREIAKAKTADPSCGGDPNSPFRDR